MLISLQVIALCTYVIFGFTSTIHFRGNCEFKIGGIVNHIHIYPLHITFFDVKRGVRSASHFSMCALLCLLMMMMEK